MGERLPCFKAYDIRGRVPNELNEELAYGIGQACAVRFRPQKMAIGHDIRLSGPALAAALADGLRDGGVAVCDLGLCGTEEIYYAAFSLAVDGGIIVTASHNPADYNGMKLVRKGAVPVSEDSGLRDIERLVLAKTRHHARQRGDLEGIDNRGLYVDHLLGYVDRSSLGPLRLVVNAGNGCAGPVIDALEKELPFSFIKILHEPDGAFPNGVPNPLLPENRRLTAEAVRAQGADMGIAWDGDFDRCFFFDERGEFIEGYYIVGLLARAMLAKKPGAKIIHDPRLVWNTIEVVRGAGGIPVMSRTGHAFIKERMRAEDALYGGEMSAHHYFRDFSYCDSGMIPWLLVAELIGTTGMPLSAMIRAMQEAYPVSGEINSRVGDPAAVLARIEEHFVGQCSERDYTDGLSMGCGSFRFNVRTSNTEPLLRLNVETRGDRQLLADRTEELLGLIRA
ncbi:MAG: phosphomannomutase [Thermodesulfobacteriota bacterium]